MNRFFEWSYPPFRNLIPELTFRYGATGGINTLLDIFLYFICYRFILKKSFINLGIIVISPHIAAFLMVFPITFSTGFLLSKYITFTESKLRGRIQLFRYWLNVLVCIFINYILLKFFVDYCGLYPTLSKILTTIFVVTYSYFAQKHFTFRTEKKTLIN